MTISSSLNASVAGLAANATRLAAISDNIAHPNGPTFKPGLKNALATDIKVVCIHQTNHTAFVFLNSSKASPAQGRPDTMIVSHLLYDFLLLWAP